MTLVHSYGFAVALCVLTMVCWGSHANTLKMEPKSYGFSLYYWDQAIGYLLLPLLAGLTFGSFGSGGRSLIDDLAQGRLSSFEWAIAGGIVFNLANILFTSAIDVAGMAVAFPIGIGIALVEGVVINYVARPSGNPLLIFSGVGLITLAIVLDALAYRNQQGLESDKAVLVKGVSLALVGGILMGLFYYLVQNSLSADYVHLDPGKFGPYAAVLNVLRGIFLLKPSVQYLFDVPSIQGRQGPIRRFQQGHAQISPHWRPRRTDQLHRNNVQFYCVEDGESRHSLRAWTGWNDDRRNMGRLYLEGIQGCFQGDAGHDCGYVCLLSYRIGAVSYGDALRAIRFIHGGRRTT